MLIRNVHDCQEFMSGDGCRIREILHPAKHPGAYRYSLAMAELDAGETSKPHVLKTSEVYYILAGEGLMRIDGEQARIKAGEAVVIPPRSVQSIANAGEATLVFLCIVDPAWRAEDETVL